MLAGLGELTPNHLMSGEAKAKSNQEAKNNPGDFERMMSRQTDQNNQTRNEPRRYESKEKFRTERQDKNEDSEVEKQRVAVLKFMDSMESELGIEPEKMLQAMKSLQNSESQATTPEESMAQTLVTLDLPSEDVERAAELYAELMVGLEAAGSKGPKPFPVSAMNFQVMTKEQIRKSELESNLNQMRSTFFGAAPAFDQPSKAVQSNTIQEPSTHIPDLMNLKDQPQVSKNQSGELSALEQFKMRGKVDGDGDSLNAMVGLMEKPKPSQQLQLQQLAAQMQMQGKNQKMNQVGSNQFSELQQATEQSNQMLNGLNVENSNSSAMFSSAGQQSQSGMDFQQFSTDAQSQDLGQQVGEEGNSFFVPTSTTASTTAGSKAAVSLGPQISGEAVEVQNVQDIVDQAQVMVRKGGGAMKVKLNPNGLGEVNLKVDVQDGKVNIQMVTEHSEAKKALEKGITELKSNLAQQKLNIETVNVDLSSDLSQNGSEQDQEASAREYARDFMGKMRDGSQSFQQDFVSTPFQSYFQQDREEIEPLEPASASSTPTRSKGSSRLHLVA